MALIAVSAGDPNGIGPDICLSLAFFEGLRGVVIGDPRIFIERSKTLNLDIEIHPLSAENDFTLSKTLKSLVGKKRHLIVHPIRLPFNFNDHPGICNPMFAGYCLNVLDEAVEKISQNYYKALVTGPLNKACIKQGGFPDFIGHTEYLANRFDIESVVMMLANKNLHVALATTHIPISDVAKKLNKIDLEKTIDIVVHAHEKLWRKKKPVIVVLGLNPHAGENGQIGNEEACVIEPAIKSSRIRNPDAIIKGPTSADTAFLKNDLKNVDCVLAMYHDQGLPVIKHNDFGNTVNITLGLPIIRLSVDHGTAYDIAGTGRASHSAMKNCISTAYKFLRSH